MEYLERNLLRYSSLLFFLYFLLDFLGRSLRSHECLVTWSIPPPKERPLCFRSGVKLEIK